MSRFTTGESAKNRNLRSRNKDSVITPILESVRVQYPHRFKALLMPCLHGPELAILTKKGIPSSNIVAIENNPNTWLAMRSQLKIDVGHKPMDANERMDYAQAEHPEGFDLIYQDFYGQPAMKHREILLKIFRFKMLKSKGVLLLNFGITRTSRETNEMNDRLTQKSGELTPTMTDILGAIELAGHPKPKKLRNHTYKSMTNKQTYLRYVTTECRF